MIKKGGPKPQCVVAPKYVYTRKSKTPTQEIVLSVMNGLSIQQIDPKLYPELRAQLLTQRSVSHSHGNKHAVAQIDKALNDINEYYSKNIC